MVLLITFLRESWDEIKRFSRDNSFNKKKYLVSVGGKLVERESRALIPGDIIYLAAGSGTPADLVVLSTGDRENGTMFVKTDQLDGETDWKTRTALKTTHKYRLRNGAFDDGIVINIEVPEASSQIYEFRGLARVCDQNRKSLKEVKEAARLENTIWMGMNIAHGEVWAMVIYCGSETKIQLNKKTPRTKWGRTDSEINTLSKVLFGVLLAISIALEAGNLWRNTWWLQIFRF